MTHSRQRGYLLKYDSILGNRKNEVSPRRFHRYRRQEIKSFRAHPPLMGSVARRSWLSPRFLLTRPSEGYWVDFKNHHSAPAKNEI